MKQRGYTLLEVLLVLVCFAAIAAWTINHYQQKVRRSQSLQVSSDVKSLQRALDSYFHVVGCKPQMGEFAQSLTVDCVSQLQASYPVVCERPPLIASYAAKVIDTGKMTEDKKYPKHIYQLQIQANMDGQFTKEQMQWYAQSLGATVGNGDSNTLNWLSVPSNSYVQLGDNNWILSGASNVFRTTENNRTFNAAQTNASGSLCAN